ncbi:MAG: NAD-dependent epimerase/dehydratase family protein [Elusimicrobia bacterium]|nr:NAD-dependent epimerase/dehydratase family protein [Elusimicrobiota bacterium]
MKTLVTGAAGFLGFHLSRRLLELGHEVTMIDDCSRGRDDGFMRDLAQKPNAKFLKIDLAEERHYKNLEGGYDAVFHLAAINGTKNFYERPKDVLRVDLLATIHLLDWFAAKGNKLFLFASTAETYAGAAVAIPTPEEVMLVVSDPFNPRWSYGGSKIAGELLTINYSRQHRFPFVVLRYNNIYGPRAGYDHVIPAFIMRLLQRQDPFKIYGADCTRTFCYVDDAVQATILAATQEAARGLIMHVGSDLDGEMTMRDLAKKMFTLFEYSPRIEELPPPKGSPLRRRPMLEKLYRNLQFKPAIRLEEGLRRTFEWYQKHGRNQSAV